MPIQIILITAVSGLIATLLLGIAKFLEKKLSAREDDQALGKILAFIIKRDWLTLDQKTKDTYSSSAKIIYGIFWSWPIPLLFLAIEPLSYFALFGLIIVYFFIFIVQENLFFRAFKVGTPIWVMDKKRIVSEIILKLIYSVSGVFGFVLIAYYYILSLAN